VVTPSALEIGFQPPISAWPAANDAARAAGAVPDGAVDSVGGPARDDAGEPDESAAGFSDRVAVLATLADAAERADTYAGQSKSQATITAYASGWRDF
jgi:hypothetical protein